MGVDLQKESDNFKEEVVAEPLRLSNKERHQHLRYSIDEYADVGQHVKGKHAVYLHIISVRHPIIAQQRRNNAGQD